MDNIVTLVVEENQPRLDKYLARAIPDVSRAAVQRWIKEGRVTLNGVVINKAGTPVPLGAQITVHIPPPPSVEVRPELIPLDIVYEDDQCLVINKPAGMVVHPAYGHHSGTLVNALLARYPNLEEVGGPERAGIVHRLDKDTSGLILVAKTPEAHRALQRQFKERTVTKVYLALVEGHPEPPHGLIDAPLGRDRRHRKRMAVLPDGRPAQTTYRAIEYFPEHTLVEVHPHTGRTHQVRVHLAFLGHPVAGDEVYGRRKQRLRSLGLKRQFLHASRLGFRLPGSGQPVEFQAPLPPDLQQVLERLRTR